MRGNITFDFSMNLSLSHGHDRVVDFLFLSLQKKAEKKLFLRASTHRAVHRVKVSGNSRLKSCLSSFEISPVPRITSIPVEISQLQLSTPRFGLFGRAEKGGKCGEIGSKGYHPSGMTDDCVFRKNLSVLNGLFGPLSAFKLIPVPD